LEKHTNCLFQCRIKIMAILFYFFNIGIKLFDQE
jgi:hypothetical protein